MLRYCTETLLNEDSADWTVTTDKNLSFSNLFLFNLFYDGDTSPVAVSETFNITDTSTSSTSTTSSTSSTSPTSSSFATSPTRSIASSTDGATVGTGSASDESGSGSGELVTGAKIGIGIAVPVVALLGIAACYFLFRHRAKKQQYAATSLAPGQAPAEQKPAGIIPGQRYELDGLNDGGISSMTHELYGDYTRH